MCQMKRCVVIRLVCMLLSGLSITTAAQDRETQLAETKELMRRAVELAETDHIDEAISLAKRILATFENTLGSENLDVASSLTFLGMFYAEKGNYIEAEPLYKRALAIREKILGLEHLQVAESLNFLGRLYEGRGDYVEAERLHKRALAIRERILGLEHPDVATALDNLAMPYVHKGDYAQAEQLHKRALQIREKTLGPEHIDVAESLNNLATLYADKGDYGEVESLYKRALAIREKVLGAEHPEVAILLNNLAVLYTNKGELEQAAQLYKRALAIREKKLGPEHPDVATSLDDLASLYAKRGDYGEAERLHKRALAIREKVLDREHPDVAASLNHLASLYAQKGDYVEAEPLYKRALAIREKVLGPEHPQVLTSIDYLASLYADKGDYLEAERLHKRALLSREKRLGPEHPHVAISLNDLALLYVKKGDYAQAEPLYERALTILEKKLGPEHPDVAGSLNNLGILYVLEGDYVRAEPLYKRALAIRERVLGREHPSVAYTLNSLADLYGAKGDYVEAERLQKRALALFEKIFGPEHLNVASSLSNLALLYVYKGEYAEAEPLYKRALAISEKKLGPEHPDVAISLNNLASLYLRRGDWAQAEPLHKRALVIREKALGPDHPDVANSLNNLASLYARKGDYARAEPLYERALAIREKVLGPQHLDVAVSLGNLAAIYDNKGDYARAVQVLARGSDAEERTLKLILATGSERQKQVFLNTLLGTPHFAVSLQIRSGAQAESAAQLALTTILQRKGRALDAMTDQIGVLRRNTNPKTQEMLDRLTKARSRLTALQISGGGQLSPEARRAEVAHVTSDVERLEDEVSRHSTEFRTQVSPITLDAVRQAIPADAALVEIFVYQPFKAKAKSEAEGWSPARYIVYVLRHNQAVPQWVDLGDAAEIDQDATSWRQTLGNPQLREKNESAAEFQQRMAAHEAKVKKMARNLDERVMRPVRNLLGQTRRILLSPDGALNLIPFAALVDEKEKYLLETYSINYLTSGRDLLRLQEPIENRSAAVVMADPLYDLKPASQPESVGGQVNQPVRQTDTNRRSMDFTLKTYLPLPGTAQEAAALMKLLPQGTRVFLRADATEAALKRVNRPRLLHIATHGFFEPYQAQDPTVVQSPRRSTFDTDPSPLPAGWENPLLRSGLVLAGVKQKQSGTENGIIEDGVVTALEAAGLNLWGTKLVVLSACETGLGQARKGEGVYGLRRALFLAGSETQVMSLWKVSDDGTRDLMTAYYTRLQAGEGRSEALRLVQLAMLRGQLMPARERQREKRETSDALSEAAKDYRRPYYWASFIPSGDWRSMEGK